MGKLESNLFAYDCGIRCSNCHSVILHNKIDSVRRLEFFVIIILLDHHNNVLIVLFILLEVHS